MAKPAIGQAILLRSSPLVGPTSLRATRPELLKFQKTSRRSQHQSKQMLDPDDRYQIEDHLGMELTSEDLAGVDSLDQLSRAQLAVVAKLVETRGIILAAKYIREVVPSADLSEVREFVIDIQEHINTRFP